MNHDESQIAGKAGTRGLVLAAAAAAVLAAVVLILLDFGSDPGTVAGRSGPDALEAGDRAAPGDGEDAGDERILAAERVLLGPRAGAEPSAVRVHGRVLDPEGVPLAAVGVAFRQGSLSAEGGILEGAVQSGVGGSYEIRLAAGTYAVLAAIGSQRRGHDLWYEPESVAVPAAEEFDHDVVFTRPLCEVRGSVTRPDGTPVAGVGVGLCTPAARFLRKTDTARDGTFSCGAVAPGTYRLLFDKGPNARRLSFPWPRSLAPESSPDRWPLLAIDPGEREIALHLTMAAPVKVSGMVLARGMEIPAGGRLFIREDPEVPESVLPWRRRLYSAAVGADGSFFLNDVFPGAYLACIYGLADGLARPDPVPVRVDPFLPEQNLTVSFEPSVGTCRLAGRVADQAGRGLAGARVLVWDKGARPADPALFRVFARAEAVCGADGAFAVSGLCPGSYLLARERRVLPSGPPIVIDRAGDFAVALVEGKEARVLLEVRAYEKGALRCRVEGPSLELSLRAVATFEPGGEFETYRTEARAGRDGDFLLTYVPLAPEAATVEILADLGDGREVPCARAAVIVEDAGENVLTLTRD